MGRGAAWNRSPLEVDAPMQFAQGSLVDEGKVEDVAAGERDLPSARSTGELYCV